MKDTLSCSEGITRLWWIPLFTGILCIIFGIWCFCSPETSLPVFAYVFAVCMCFAALLNFAYAYVNSGTDSGWGWALALGILELIAGVWLFALPESILVDAFIFVIGIWIIVAAINSICEACVISSVTPAWMIWMILLLVFTIIASFIFLSNPIIGEIAVWLWIGLSLISFGIFRIIFSIKANNANTLLNKRI